MAKSASGKPGKMPVSETSLRKAAERVLPNGVRLVSTEIQYLQRKLGNSATQQDMDDNVIAVRKLPWADIAIPE
jgi:hypothetical protein